MKIRSTFCDDFLKEPRSFCSNCQILDGGMKYKPIHSRKHYHEKVKEGTVAQQEVLVTVPTLPSGTIYHAEWILSANWLHCYLLSILKGSVLKYFWNILTIYSSLGAFQRTRNLGALLMLIGPMYAKLCTRWKVWPIISFPQKISSRIFLILIWTLRKPDHHDSQEVQHKHLTQIHHHFCWGCKYATPLVAPSLSPLLWNPTLCKRLV